MKTIKIMYVSGSVRCGMGTTLALLKCDVVPECPSPLGKCELHRVWGRHLDVRTAVENNELTRGWSADGRAYALQARLVRSRYVGLDSLASAAQESADLRREVEFISKADAIVMLVNSTRRVAFLGQRRMRRVEADFAEIGRPLASVPVVFQLTFRDYGPDQSDLDYRGVPLDELKQMFQWPVCDYVDSYPPRGIGVRESLNRALELYEKIHGGARPQSAGPASEG